MRSIQGLSGAAAAISAPAIGWSGYASEALHPAYPGRQLENRRPERPAAEPAAGRMIRIVGNRGAALQQLQSIIANRSLTCVENVVRVELVIVSCSVMVRQSV